MIKWTLSLLFLAFLALELSTIQSIEYHEIWILKTPGLVPTTGINYKLDDDLIVSINGRTLTIDAGFETDLASIPRILWPLFAPNDDYTVYPAIVHDYLYSCADPVTRKYADDVLYSFLLKSGASYRHALEFYLAVRFFGGSHFDKRNKNCEFTLEPPGEFYA
jgi:hypothetical protein